MKKIVHRVTRSCDKVDGTIPIYIKKDVYINFYPFTEKECDWIEFKDKNVSFDNEQIFNIRYEIDINKINGAYDKTKVILDETAEKKIEIEVFLVPDFSVSIDKTNFLYIDEGELLIKNNTKADYDVTATATENFIKFSKVRKKNDCTVIPFDIRVSSITKTQNEIAGRPYIDAAINILFTQNEITQKKVIKITVGTEFD